MLFYYLFINTTLTARFHSLFFCPLNRRRPIGPNASACRGVLRGFVSISKWSCYSCSYCGCTGKSYGFIFDSWVKCASHRHKTNCWGKQLFRPSNPMKSVIHWSRVTHMHYGDVIMSAMASQITSITSVYSNVYSGADQRKHQSSALLAFVRGIHRWSVNSPHKGPVTRKMFPFDDVILMHR